MEELGYWVNEVWLRTPVLSYYLFLASAGVSIITWSQRWRLSRIKYFIASCTLLLLFSLSLLIRAYSTDGLENGTTWIYIFSSLVIVSTTGFLHGTFSAARSRDICNHSYYAFFAIIPFLNIFLFLIRNRDDLSLNKNNSSISNFTLLLGGIILLITSIAVLSKANFQSDVFLQAALNKPQEEQIPYLIKSRGLQEALKILARNSNGPVPVDNITTFLRSEARDDSIIRILQVLIEKNALPRDIRNKVVTSICSRPVTLAILKEGGIVVDRYISKDGDILAEISVKIADCQN